VGSEEHIMGELAEFDRTDNPFLDSYNLGSRDKAADVVLRLGHSDFFSSQETLKSSIGLLGLINRVATVRIFPIFITLVHHHLPLQNLKFADLCTNTFPGPWAVRGKFSR